LTARQTAAWFRLHYQTSQKACT